MENPIVSCEVHSNWGLVRKVLAHTHYINDHTGGYHIDHTPVVLDLIVVLLSKRVRVFGLRA